MAHRHAPFLQQRLEIRHRMHAGAHHGVQQEERFASVAEVLPDRVNFHRQVIGGRSGDDDDGGVLGNLRRLREHRLVDAVVVALQDVERAGVPRPLDARAAFFAVSLDEIRLHLPAGGHFDERVGNLLLALAHHVLFAILVGDDQGAVIQHVVFLHARGLAVGINVFDRQVLAAQFVRRERIAETLKAVRLVVDPDRDGIAELAQHFRRFVRQRKRLRGGEVPLFVAPNHQVVHANEDGEYGGDADDHHRAEARFPFAEGAHDLAPLAERVQRDAGQAADGGPICVLIPLRPEQANRDACKDQQRADPTDDA